MYLDLIGRKRGYVAYCLHHFFSTLARQTENNMNTYLHLVRRLAQASVAVEKPGKGVPSIYALGGSVGRALQSELDSKNGAIGKLCEIFAHVPFKAICACGYIKSDDPRERERFLKFFSQKIKRCIGIGVCLKIGYALFGAPLCRQLFAH